MPSRALYPTQPFRNLRRLQLNHDDKLTDEGFLAFESAVSLVDIELDNCIVTDVALQK